LCGGRFSFVKFFIANAVFRCDPNREKAAQKRPQRPRTAALYRVAFADFSTAPWQDFEKSERCPNSSSLFLPQAAVVAVANPAAPTQTKKQTHKSVAAVTPVDIPTGWDPRAKQQPTGLIACGAAHRRPVQIRCFDLNKKADTQKCVCFFWSEQRDLNPRPPRPERGALPTALCPENTAAYSAAVTGWG
jgi:hypothetical protein